MLAGFFPDYPDHLCVRVRCFPPRPNKKTENAVQPSSTLGGTGLGSATMAAEAAEEDGAKRPEPLELEGSIRETSFGIGTFTRTLSSKAQSSPSHSLTNAFSKLARSPSQKEARLSSAREQPTGEDWRRRSTNATRAASNPATA